MAAGGVYVGMSQKYKARFFPNTQINGVDASGKTAAEVQELISEGVNGYTLTIDERNNQTETIAGTDIKLHAEFDGSLEKDGSGAESVRMAVAYETGRIYDRNDGDV